MGEHRFNRHTGYKGARMRWRCSRTHNSPSVGAVFTTTRAGNPVLVLGSYRFNRHAGYKGPRMLWRCTRAPEGCRATIITYENEIIQMPKGHNH
ncbi:hypothetical protein MSG28_008192 [Choristoneura fumiferana]|uniref:Uncharacterized protein n=1 Tax=Choristoneura fumiferana TaxID=7141 RepID=A0ACC0JAB0_CHOFU|nr:hypothetical protein MSG28_008192 [Choristoneura fumiferana]